MVEVSVEVILLVMIVLAVVMLAARELVYPTWFERRRFQRMREFFEEDR